MKAVKNVAILASDDMMPGAVTERGDAFERDEQMGKLVPALAMLGVDCALLRWREAAERAGDYDAVLPLLCWDYWDEREAFLTVLERAAKTTRVLNGVELLRWNTDKRYLEELGAGTANLRGAPIIETEVVERIDSDAVARAFDRFGTDRLVIKPQVGAGAWRQVSVRRGEALPDAGEMPSGRAMIQPFLKAVETEGEISMLFFDGVLSHALRKTPKPGDYRIQSLYGGREEAVVATPDMIAIADGALAQMQARFGALPLYARVDVLRGNAENGDGSWRLIECEMVEPYLYFGLSDGEGGENAGARAFAAALVNRLDN